MVEMQCDGPASLLSLPIDATLHTFALLDICDVFSVICTCRALRKVGRVGLPPECVVSVWDFEFHEAARTHISLKTSGYAQQYPDAATHHAGLRYRIEECNVNAGQ